jgi:hypothetical protein
MKGEESLAGVDYDYGEQHWWCYPFRSLGCREGARACQSRSRISTNADLSASVAAYLSLPGFNATSPLQIDTGNTNGNQANALVKAVSEDETLKTALQQFDEGLKKLTLRPETQIFQARFGADAHANNNVNDNLPAPEPLPGVGRMAFSARRRQIAKWLPTPITTER